MNIADQIREVRLNINQYCAQAGRSPSRVKLLAVSKTHPAIAIQDAYESGITEFGESYLQESLVKIEECKHIPIIWHFIGPIQSNKTRPIAENFDWVQSVDREKIITRLDQQRPPQLGPLKVCIQANLFNEPQKKGVSQEQLTQLLAIAAALPNIQLRGLMVIPPKRDTYQEQLAQFNQVSEIFNELRKEFTNMDTLSMGMSGDMEAAIASGSNMVRVGTGIFGPRRNN
ncbi:YggS family pyridoxal phosphate-dependent enzyme [Aliikangiella coralliicola]|uniref:Pyridoxal phosphate homeostasis protein n=1 Tax=Aliikangiella coralliicola TaxID=2592383 RepID=A0A545U784_9GAMM|nr:YggS family pyridoxal phosphate-dependent enzyme [Aliikangiella coralliicola]TQV85337.1 YggS family pyridoxal phosphate-dependent enzyme [Aliikangiella coralliicola]